MFISYGLLTGFRTSGATGWCTLIRPGVARIVAGEDPVPHRTAAKAGAGPTVADVAKRYLREHTAVQCKPRTLQIRRTAIARLRGTLMFISYGLLTRFWSSRATASRDGIPRQFQPNVPPIPRTHSSRVHSAPNANIACGASGQSWG